MLNCCLLYRYLLNYLPFSLAYKACNLLPIKLVIVILREVYRARQIHTGFVYASTKYPNSMFIVGLYAITLGLYVCLYVYKYEYVRLHQVYVVHISTIVRPIVYILTLKQLLTFGLFIWVFRNT